MNFLLDLDSPQNSSPFRNIVNIQASAAEGQQATKPPTPRKRPPTMFVPPRPNSNANAKKRKTVNKDDLSTIPVPKYNYPQLDFCVRQKANTDQQNGSDDDFQQSDPNDIESSPKKQTEATNYSIEDSSSAEETSIVDSATGHATNGTITTDSCAERANLLNQDNTLFLGINTQQLYSGCSPTDPITQTSSSQPTTASSDQTTTTNQNENENQNENTDSNQQPEPAVPTVAAVSLPRPSTSSSSSSSTLSRLNGDRTEFLHFVDIRTIQSSLKSVISESGEKVSSLAVEVLLQHQCNANNRIIVKGDALKLLMRLTDKEWAAVKSILTTLGTFWFEQSKSMEPMEGSLLHRAMYYLFKATSKTSTAHIAYGDSDLETARVFYKPNSSTENVTSTINPFVLAAMKAKAQEEQQQQQQQELSETIVNQSKENEESD